MLSRVISFFNTRTAICPDGSTKVVHRNLDAAFPLYVAGWDANLSAELKSAQVDGKVSGNYRSKIDGLLIALDDSNNNVMLEFRAAYVAYQTDPCSNSAYFLRALERISDKRDAISKLKLKIGALIEMAKAANNLIADERFADLFFDIVSDTNPEKTVPLTVEDLREAEQTAHSMTRDVQ